MKKERAIVFTLSSDLIFAVACVILDLRKFEKSIPDEVVIIHDGISKRDQKVLGSILPTRFILYDFPIRNTRIFNKETIAHFTKMAFAKYECFKLLNEYHNVLLLDYDIVIQKDISDLFDPCDSGIKLMPGGMKVRDQLHEPIDAYDMDAEAVCTSTFVLQDHLKDYMKIYEFCYDCLLQYGKYLYMGEQAIFDFLIQKFKLTISPIDGKIYSPHPTNIDLANDAKILHAYGYPKFWNGLSNTQWSNNYKKWLRMGGKKYRKVTLKNALHKLKAEVKTMIRMSLAKGK